MVAAFNLQGASWSRRRRQFIIHDSSPPVLTTRIGPADVDVFRDLALQVGPAPRQSHLTLWLLDGSNWDNQSPPSTVARQGPRLSLVAPPSLLAHLCAALSRVCPSLKPSNSSMLCLQGMMDSLRSSKFEPELWQAAKCASRVTLQYAEAEGSQWMLQGADPSRAQAAARGDRAMPQQKFVGWCNQEQLLRRLDIGESMPVALAGGWQTQVQRLVPVFSHTVLNTCVFKAT